MSVPYKHDVDSSPPKMQCDCIPLKLKTRKDELFAQVGVELMKRAGQLSPFTTSPSSHFLRYSLSFWLLCVPGDTLWVLWRVL